jgi:hypothetical protein
MNIMLSIDIYKTAFITSFIIVIFCLGGCKSNSVDSVQALNGRWVEATGRGDTLIFNAKTSSLLEVRREIEIKNGLKQRKAGHGLWEFSLLKNYQMSVRYSLSSSGMNQTSHVEIKDNLLYVSSFYELELAAFEIRTFSQK